MSDTVVRWRPGARWSRRAVPAGLWSWLMRTGSLTARLEKACAGRFRVRVLSQGWQRPRLDEWRALDGRAGERALVREVHLLCDGRPWVYARTVIPARSLRGAQRRLACLGERPLGAYLFAQPGLWRGPVELACIRRGSALYRAALAGSRARPPAIWGRRSVFRLSGRPLLVAEVFLPGLPDAG